MKNYTIYVDGKTAKQTTQKGFPVDACELLDETFRNGIANNIYENEFTPDDYYIRKCPTTDQICNWLRIEHKVLISVFTKLNGDYDYYGNVCKMDRPEYGCGAEGNDYRDVLITCINKALELI